MRPLADSDPTQRPEARQQTPAAEAVAWLEDPQPPPPPESLQERIARELAEAIGWPVEKMRRAIADFDYYPGDQPKEHEREPSVSSEGRK